MPYNIFYMRPSSFVSYYRARTHHYCLFMNDAIIYHALQITSILLRFFFFIFIHSFFFQYCIEVGTEYYVHAYCVLCNKYKTKRRKKKEIYSFLRKFELRHWRRFGSRRYAQKRTRGTSRLPIYISHSSLLYNKSVSVFYRFRVLGKMWTQGERERQVLFAYSREVSCCSHIRFFRVVCLSGRAPPLLSRNARMPKFSIKNQKPEKKKMDVLVRGRYGALQ